MNNRDVNQDQFEEEENAGLLGKLPTEKLVEVAEILPFKDAKSLRLTCRFFGNHVFLKETMDKKNIHQVIAAGDHTFWIFKNGKVFGTGSNYSGAIGVGEEVKSCFNPIEINLPSNKPIKKIVAGYNFTFYFDSDGDCYFSGSNTCGQLGKSDIIQYSFRAMRLPNDRPIIDVVVGHTNSFLRDDEGSWYGLGDNDRGKLGINSQVRYTDIPVKISLSNELPITKIIAGQYQTFFQDSEDHWYHCGYGKHIGKATSIYMPEFFTLSDDKPIIEIVSKLRSTFIRNNEGQWYAFGDNSYGQLGIKKLSDRGEYMRSITYLQLPNGKPIEKIVSSGDHTFMQDIDGQWFGCGSNSDGKLLQTNASQIELTPITLPNGNTPMEIQVGDGHTLLKSNEGNWYSCGNNQHGGLGPKNMKMVKEDLFYIDPTIFEKINEKPEKSELLQSRPRNS